MSCARYKANASSYTCPLARRNSPSTIRDSRHSTLGGHERLQEGPTLTAPTPGPSGQAAQGAGPGGVAEPQGAGPGGVAEPQGAGSGGVAEPQGAGARCGPQHGAHAMTAPSRPDS